MTTETRPAPAKLNLTLRVVGRRPDGYHLLDSFVAFTEYGDTVTAETAEDGLSLTVEGPFGAMLAASTEDASAGDNLVIRAARLLAEEAGIAPRARLTLVKRLPVASGIGGGSSDAAATLLALADLWTLRPASEDLARLALSLGADVPVCLRQRTARLQGIGERIGPAPRLPAVPILLVNPGLGLSTPAVFKEYARQAQGAFADEVPGDALQATRIEDAAGLAGALAGLGNDLTRPACTLQPAIETVLAALDASEGSLTARMSGSGATCFALYAEMAAAERAEAALKAAHPDWWAVATRLRAS